MTAWHPDTPPWYTHAANHACTAKQLEVLKLASHHTSDRNIGRILGISRESVRGHREAAYRRIEQALKESAA